MGTCRCHQARLILPSQRVLGLELLVGALWKGMELPERLPDLTPQSLLPIFLGTTKIPSSPSSPRADSGCKIRVDFRVHVWNGRRISIKSQPLRGLGKRDPPDAQTPASPWFSRQSYCSRASLKPQLRPARPAYPRFFPTAGPRATPPSVTKPRARKERTTLCVPVLDREPQFHHHHPPPCPARSWPASCSGG